MLHILRGNHRIWVELGCVFRQLNRDVPVSLLLSVLCLFQIKWKGKPSRSLAWRQWKGLTARPIDQYHLSPLVQTIEVGVCVLRPSCKRGAGALSNLAMIADWNYALRIENAGRQRPNRVADSARTCWTSIGKKTGYINVLFSYKSELFRPYARNSFVITCNY